MVSLKWINSSKVSEILLHNAIHFTFRKLHLQIKWISSSISMLLQSSHVLSSNLMLWYLPVSIPSCKIPQRSFAKTDLWYLGKNYKTYGSILTLSLNKIYVCSLGFWWIAIKKSDDITMMCYVTIYFSHRHIGDTKLCS